MMRQIKILVRSHLLVQLNPSLQYANQDLDGKIKTRDIKKTLL